jgi:hypothetical protein
MDGTSLVPDPKPDDVELDPSEGTLVSASDGDGVVAGVDPPEEDADGLQG